LLDSHGAPSLWQRGGSGGGKARRAFSTRYFPDRFGTSTNTNANEVISNVAVSWRENQSARANTVHPNDHVNMGQSSNDVIPSAIHISAAEELKNRLFRRSKRCMAAGRCA